MPLSVASKSGCAWPRQRLEVGEVLPDQEGRSDRQFPSDPAIGNIIGWARSWGPFATVDVVPALE